MATCRLFQGRLPEKNLRQEWLALQTGSTAQDGEGMYPLGLNPDQARCLPPPARQRDRVTKSAPGVKPQIVVTKDWATTILAKAAPAEEPPGTPATAQLQDVVEENRL